MQGVVVVDPWDILDVASRQAPAVLQELQPVG
jgi:hypothetical protein